MKSFESKEQREAKQKKKLQTNLAIIQENNSPEIEIKSFTHNEI